MPATKYLNGKVQVAYLLPPALIYLVKEQASQENRRPAHIVESVLKSHFESRWTVQDGRRKSREKVSTLGHSSH